MPTLNPPMRLLMGPGPSMVEPRVYEAMRAPLVSHVDPYFFEVVEHINQHLRLVFGTRNPFTMAISGTGTAGMETAILNFIAPGDKVALFANGYFCDRIGDIASRNGAEVVRCEKPWGEWFEDAEAAGFIARVRPNVVAYVQAETSTGVFQDGAAICRAAHDAGALVSLDAFHAVGVLPVDVRRSGADFVTGGVLKWLCGGPGGCFLYVAPAVRDTLEPALTGWQAHARPFAFESEMEYATGAFRWLNGTPAIPALYAALEGPRIVRRAGIEAIRAKSIRQTSRLIQLADDRGFRVHAPRDAERRGGTVAIRVPHAYEVSQTLLSRDILVDYRPEAGIRIAPHFYTRDDELESVFGAIDEILEREEWRAFSGERKVVT